MGTVAGRILGWTAGVFLAGAACAADQTDTAIFDFSLKGVQVGTLSINGKISGKGYGVAGRLQSGGLAALVRKVSYDARARGSYSGGRFVPSRYEEDADTGKRKSQSVMDYRKGVPQVKVYNPPKAPKPGDVDPATQGGTTDPLTAAYAALRDVPAAEACKLKIAIFDGRRRSQVSLSDPKPGTDGRIICAGEYRRLQGFSAEDMAEKSRFAFSLTYAPADGGRLRVIEVALDSIYGKGRLTRR